MEEKTVHIPGINCGHCVASIQRELGKLAGVKAVAGDAGSKRITVRWEKPLTWTAIVENLSRLGYPPET